MSQQQQQQWNPIYHLYYLLHQALTCSCLPLPPRFRRSSSPTPSHHSGELEALLIDANDHSEDLSAGWRDDDLDDALSLRGVSSRSKRPFQNEQPRKKKRDMLGGLFGRRVDPPSTASLSSGLASTSESSRRKRTTSNATSTRSGNSFIANSLDSEEEDAESLGPSTIAALPELAKKWEPEITIEQLEREEAEQARRELELLERLGRLNPEEEFGDYTGARGVGEVSTEEHGDQAEQHSGGQEGSDGGVEDEEEEEDGERTPRG